MRICSFSAKLLGGCSCSFDHHCDSWQPHRVWLHMHLLSLTSFNSVPWHLQAGPGVGSRRGGGAGQDGGTQRVGPRHRAPLRVRVQQARAQAGPAAQGGLLVPLSSFTSCCLRSLNLQMIHWISAPSGIHAPSCSIADALSTSQAIPARVGTEQSTVSHRVSVATPAGLHRAALCTHRTCSRCAAAACRHGAGSWWPARGSCSPSTCAGAGSTAQPSASPAPCTTCSR